MDQQQRQDGVERQTPGAPPTAFRLWKFGPVEFAFGTFLFTKRSAALIMAEQVERDVDYPFDFDHLSMRKDLPPELRSAAGFHRLEVRDDGLWLVDCRWTERAARLLTAGEYKYFSPVFHADPQTQEIIQYLSTALTNTPATHECMPLAASMKAGAPIAGVAPNPERIAAALDMDRKSRIRTAERYHVLAADGSFLLAATREQAILNLPPRMQEAALSFTPHELQVTLNAAAAAHSGRSPYAAQPDRDMGLTNVHGCRVEGNTLILSAVGRHERMANVGFYEAAIAMGAPRGFISRWLFDSEVGQ